ncbi:hypothetical protein Slin15195_G126750 [Septoria linicola]|uniref:Uncharacterized protein n=1 Tax=Septoria linicola TaxID=215465 RepID=A0A9Q9EQ18_9PEZI|nr:hypothetical protein Slin15195_G126750 [Septoria linicola]
MENSKAQEALQDGEEVGAPPPVYKERASLVTDSDDFQIIEAQDAMSQDEKHPIEESSTSPQLHEKKAIDTPSRTPSMLKEKGPEYPPRPSKELPDPVDDQDAITPVVDSSYAPPPLPLVDDDKKMPQVHFADQEEVPPSLPRRTTTTRFSEDFSRQTSYPGLAPPLLPAPLEASGGIPLAYTFAWHRPILDFPNLHIAPTNNAAIPSSYPDIPPTASWRLNYDSKYHARLQRYTAAQTASDRHTAQVGDFPFRQIAEVKFPEFIIPGAGCGATVKFDPHEEELARLGNVSNISSGKKPSPRVQKFMQCTGWLSTRYSMEIPVLDHLQASWKTIPRPRTTRIVSGGVSETQEETAIVERKTSDIERQARNRNVKLITIGDLIDQARRTLNDETWTPYAPQQLIIEFDGRCVATYQRASPWAKHAGTLTIRQPEIGQVQVTPEFIEGIIIATAAMVGMQDRIGLASGLMEAANTSSKWGLDVADKSASWSAEQWKRAQREWKARRASRAAAAASADTHPYQNSAARARDGGMYEAGEVGSEVFDDGLAGVLSVEEREAARTEQMAWDEKNRQKVRVVEVRPVTATRRREPRNELARERLNWEEKAKVVYA